MVRLCMLCCACLLTALAAADPQPPHHPDRELPVPGSVVLSGSLRLPDLASFPMVPSAPVLKSGPRVIEVAAALGALPDLGLDRPAKAVPDWLHLLATGRELPAPLAGTELGLLVVGPEISLDHQVCRIEAIRRGAVGMQVELGVWSEPMPERDATPAPVRRVWLLRLPPMPAGPCALSMTVRWHERDPAGGLIQSEGWAAGPLLSCTVAATATAAAGGRAAVSLPILRERALRPAGGGEWLPQAVMWSHCFQPPAVLAGTGLLGVRDLDVPAISHARANQDKAPTPEAILASGTSKVPTLVVNGPMLNLGEHATLRSATWNKQGDRLEVVLAVWHDGLPRAANIRHQETILLPLHRPAAGGGPVAVALTWESRFLDETSRWYDREPGRPRNLPDDTVSTWTGMVGAPDGKPASAPQQDPRVRRPAAPPAAIPPPGSGSNDF